MAAEIVQVSDGSVTTPAGFLAGATYAGLKTYGDDRLDVGILLSESPAVAAGTFTTSKVRSASVTLSERRVASGLTRAVVANSGCANACVGEQGLKDAIAMTAQAAAVVGVAPEEVLVCSTGIIGVELPMALIRSGVQRLTLAREGGHAFARAILTTDYGPKEQAVSFEAGGVRVHVAGCAKGAGMIHPNMATMLAFVTTDASVEIGLLRDALKKAVDASFNMIDVDGDTSTNDTVLVLANGAAGGPTIQEGTPEAAAFQEALRQVCTELAIAIARNGEGATKLIEVVVEGARSEADARLAARSVAGSLLVKTAVYGNDPNWGRIMMALGKSGAEMEESRMALYINEVCIMEDGLPISYFKDAVIANMKQPTVRLMARLGMGDASATAWGCDMSEAFVTFNSAYTT